MNALSPLAVLIVAEVATPAASRYLQQLCKHFAHKRPAAFDQWSGEIDFPMGICRLAADEEALSLSLAAPDHDQMTKLQDVIARHLLRFAFREPLKIEWNAAEKQSNETAEGAPAVQDHIQSRHRRAHIPSHDAVPLNPFGPIRDSRVRAVIEKLNSNRSFPQNAGARGE